MKNNGRKYNYCGKTESNETYEHLISSINLKEIF